jgi:serine/threonine-protein kinase
VSRASFGKFQTVGRIARGGMADVFLCRLQGIGGFHKDVVVKCILPERADDPDFVTMFLDEARVAANLTHPGIVQVFEIGEQDGIPYIAMEYVKGVTLAMVMREMHRQKNVHYGHCVKIVMAICEALDYAHNAAGPDGEPLGLVHRDVTPGNIVISREGVPKLLDFGVAKTNRRLSETQAGTLKGKLRYMPPEQVSMGTVDQRADIFSLGICLYELTTFHHPFGPIDGNDVALLRSIVDGNTTIAPSQVVPDYPPELEKIVLGAIERDVGKRIGSAREMRDRLEAFAASGPYGASTRELVAWLRDLFPDFGSLTKTGDLTIFAGTHAGALPAPPPSGPAPTVSTSTTKLTTLSRPPAGVRRGRLGDWIRSVRAWWWSVGVLAAAAAVLMAVRSHQPIVIKPPGRIVSPGPGEDEAARKYLDAADQMVAEKRLEPALQMLGKAAELKIRSAELNIRLTQLRDAVTTAALIKQAETHLQQKEWGAAIDAAKNALDRNPESAEAVRIIASGRSSSAPPAPPVDRSREQRREGTLTITTSPPAMIYVDDEPIGRSPLSRRVPAGAHRVQVRSHGFRPGEAQIKVAPGQTVALVLPLVSEPALPATTLPAPVERPAARRPSPEPPPAPPPPVEGSAPALPIKPTSAAVTSAMPRTPIPMPTLPRLVFVHDPDQLNRVCQLVELLAVSRAGVTREFARGVTLPLRRRVGASGLVYPVAMYYFVVHEAALGHDSVAAAANLAAAHGDGSIVKLNDLPAVERDL